MCRRRSLLAMAILVMASLTSILAAQSFKAQQLKSPRVQKAAREVEPKLKALFQEKGLAYPPKAIFIRVFKRERELEVWVRTTEEVFTLVKTYPICATSGTLGPKRRQGDGQVPEGFYVVRDFNPASSFHLSLGINYPNASDRILGEMGRLGGSIYIHGNCVTIGCVPITDAGIEEVYLLAVEAREAGQREIPVHIFPARLSDGEFRSLEREFRSQPVLLQFWFRLKPGFDYFEGQRKVPRIGVDAKGNYVLGN